MHKASTKAICCPEYDPIPNDVCCFLPDICKDFRRIQCRQRIMTTKKKRILNLAYLNGVQMKRFVANCPCKFKMPIEIIRLDGVMHTRTEQLAFPQVRKLLLFKKSVKGLYDSKRHEIINRLIRYSLLSLYSRLENVQPPQPIVPVPKWDADEWKQHTRYLRKLAKHKVPPPQPKLPILAIPFSKMRRYKKLALPKQRDEPIKEFWVLKPGMKFYSPTDRILQLSRPQMRDDSALYQPLPIQITPTALKYKPTSRIKELATARERGPGEMDIKENPFGIAPNALKARATARVQELAEPKEYENVHIRDNPFLISPAALKAKASPRTIELAKPKGT